MQGNLITNGADMYTGLTPHKDIQLFSPAF